VPGHDLDLDLADLIVPHGTPVPDEQPVALGGEQLARMIDGAAALLAKVAEAHKERAFPLRVPHLRSLILALVGLVKSSRDVVDRVQHDAAHWATLPAADERAPRWTGEAPPTFELPPGTPDEVRNKLMEAVGEWGRSSDSDLDVAEATLLQLAALLTPWDQPARPIVEPVGEENET
jgi:hypothetical protein